jgi:putative oxidoreductase
MYVLELVVLYLGGSLAILLVGPGRFSFDAGLVSALVTPQNRDAATSAVPVSNA